MSRLYSCLVVLWVCLLCSCGVRTQQLTYIYKAQPKHSLKNKEQTIKVEVGRDSMRPLVAQVQLPMDKLNWISTGAADVTVKMNITQWKATKNDPYVTTVYNIVSSGNQPAKEQKYKANGRMYGRIDIQVVDKNGNVIAGTYAGNNKEYSAPAQYTAYQAKSALNQLMQRDQTGLLAELNQKAVRVTKNLLHTSFNVHDAHVRLQVPPEHEDEPRIAQAFAILSQPSPENARKALQVYEAIGYANVKPGSDKLNENLNETVVVGMIACHQILRDHQEVAKLRKIKEEM